MLKKREKAFIAGSALLAVISVLVVYSAFFIASNVKSKNRAYYSGDVIVHNNQLIVGTTNMGLLEVFVLEGDRLVQTIGMESFEARFGGWDPFYDLTFSHEDGILYVYLVDGRYLYKYDIDDLANPFLVDRVKDNSYDWLLGVKKFNGEIATVGTKGLKVWTPELGVVDTFKLDNPFQYNINFSSAGEFIFNVIKDRVDIYDTKTRLTRVSLPTTVREEHNRKTYADPEDGKIYLVDDRELVQFSYDGEILNTFKHISRLGYEVAGVAGSPFVYFSDGIGIVKIDKATFEPVLWSYTTRLGEPGGWAMGLNVADADGEKVVVFNNTSILVFDDRLRLIDSIESFGEDFNPIEPLSLSVDKYRAPTNAEISLRGAGFGLGEELLITFANDRYEAQADENGKFIRILTVPAISPTASRWVDITVVGKTSKRHYSTSFNIE